MIADDAKRDPRSVADAVPPVAYIVALVRAEGQGAEGAEAAASVATALARQREHTLLVSGAHDESFLDELLGGADGDGLAAALSGRARLTDVAIQPADRPFVYLPAGRDPSELSTLLGEDSFTSFAERVRQRGGTLLLALPEARLDEPGIRDLVDGYVALGEAVSSDAHGLPMYARLGFREISGLQTGLVNVDAAAGDAVGEDAASDEAVPGGPPPDEAVPDGVLHAADGLPPGESGIAPELAAAPGAFTLGEPHEEGPPAGEVLLDEAEVEAQSASWRHHRASAGFPTRRVAIGVVSVAALFVGWWWLASGLRGTSDTGVDSTMSAPESSSSTAGAGEPEAEAAPSIPPAEAAAAAGRAPELPYSVLIASYAARSDAEDRLGRLLQSEGGPYFVVPTVVRGALYHRVFAGAEPDVETARALMTELVDSGRKDDASAWHLRPARLAYLLGVFGSRTEAEGRMQEAATAGIPAYILSTAVEEGLGIDSVFQVYAGAYESPVAARAMIALLESAGEEPPLVDRRGQRR